MYVWHSGLEARPSEGSGLVGRLLIPGGLRVSEDECAAELHVRQKCPAQLRHALVHSYQTSTRGLSGLVSAHEGGQTEHAVLTRYHGRDCTQREHERVHEHKRYVVIPLRPERRFALQTFVHGW